MKRKERYTLMMGDVLLGSSTSVDGIAKLLGCTRQHIYQNIREGYFTYKKNNYQMIDKLA